LLSYWEAAINEENLLKANFCLKKKKLSKYWTKSIIIWPEWVALLVPFILTQNQFETKRKNLNFKNHIKLKINKYWPFICLCGFFLSLFHFWKRKKIVCSEFVRQCLLIDSIWISFVYCNYLQIIKIAKKNEILLNCKWPTKKTKKGLVVRITLDASECHVLARKFQLFP